MIQDLRYGVRMLLKHKGFTAVAALTLAIGIGANTAIFSVMNALLLRSLPVKDPEELALLAGVYRTGVHYTFSYPMYEEFRDSGRSLSGLFAATAISKRRMNCVGMGTEYIGAQEVTGNFFSVLGVTAALGRTLTIEDDRVGQPRVAVISHSFWQRRFSADPAVIGRTIACEDAAVTIVGVTPPNFFGFQPGEHPDLWWPVQTLSWKMLKREDWWLRLMGRLPPGANRAQAQAELDLIFQRRMDEYITRVGPNLIDQGLRDRASHKLELQPGAVGYTDLRRQFRRSVLLLMTAVGLVLLIACANIASLLLVRAAAQQREFTVRSALGAGSVRLVRQSLTESLLLASLGGLLGLFLSQAGIR